MEDSDDKLVVEEEKVKSRPRKKNLYKQILKQMEFYFGDVNLSKDRFLSRLIAKNKKVPLEIFLTFNRIKLLTTDLQDLVNALSRSRMLKVSEDGQEVYRITPIGKKENENSCTIYVEQLPPDATHDWVQDIFSVYGTVDYVSIPKYKNKQAIKGFAFVEYSTPEEAQKALEAFAAAGCCLSSQMLPEELCSIATYEEVDSEPQKGGKEIKPQQKSDEQEVISSSSGANVMEDSQEEADDIEGSVEKKTKKRKRKLSEELEEEDATEASVEEEGKEKKKRKKHERLEQEKGDEDSLKKKRKKREAEDEDEGPIEADQEQDEEDQEQGGGRKKKVSTEGTKVDEGETEEIGELECSEKEELEEKNEDEETGMVKKKKNRKRSQKRKKKEEPTYLSLRIMSKVEWLRLRSKYLKLQREKLGALKRMRQEKLDAVNKRMRRSQWGSNYLSPAAESGTQEAAGRKKPHKTPSQFIPGVILQVDLPEPVSNAREFQIMVKTHEDIAYVDVEEGSTKMYLRLVSAPASQKMLADRPWEKMSLLKGKEEKQYWDKVLEKRKILEGAKLQGRDKQVKMRGRNKVLKRAESELGKHITFDDGDE